MSEPAYDGRKLLRAAAARHGVRFEILVAETALWAHPEVHRRLVQETGAAAWFPNVRRARAQNGEKRGQTRDGVRFDDNSAANLALKTALGIPAKDLVNFETCHLWPNTCYDERYHTAIADLALLPRALAGFSDHDPDVQAALQYRAFELYGWHPDGTEPPTRPSFYPDQWRNPEPFGPRVAAALARRIGAPRTPFRDGVARPGEPPVGQARPFEFLPGERMCAGERAFVVGRIQLWAGRPHQIPYRTLAVVTGSPGRHINRGALVATVERITGSRNAAGAVASLKTSKGNAFGRVLIEGENGMVRVHPVVASEVAQHEWLLEGGHH